MGHLNVSPLQLADELGLVVAGDAQRRAIRHHRHHQPQHVGDTGATIHQVAYEYGFASLRVIYRKPGTSGATDAGLGDPVLQSLQQRHQFVEAPVYISDDVEGARLLLAVGPRRHPLD